MPSRLSFAVTLPIVLAIAPAVLAQTQQTAVSAEAPQKLVAEVIYNEMHDRERDSFWEYRSQRLEAGRELVREQVETAEGPVFRVLERGGVPLDNAARVSEEQRLSALVEHPGAMDKVRRAHEADEERLQKVMEMLPKAFLFTAGNPSGNVETIAFRPDPAFVPSGYEERIMHAMAGTITVDTRLKRMIAMRGTLVQRVDFGYGILGHVEQGGTFEIGRVQVSPEHWKTSLVEVHVEGKILLFKDVTKDQRETRTEFRPVSHEITLSQAKALLDKAAASSGSELASAASSH